VGRAVVEAHPSRQVLRDEWGTRFGGCSEENEQRQQKLQVPPLRCAPVEMTKLG
jgi:hypothetical protein